METPTVGSRSEITVKETAPCFLNQPEPSAFIFMVDYEDVRGIRNNQAFSECPVSLA